MSLKLTSRVNAITAALNLIYKFQYLVLFVVRSVHWHGRFTTVTHLSDLSTDSTGKNEEVKQFSQQASLITGIFQSPWNDD